MRRLIENYLGYSVPIIIAFLVIVSIARFIPQLNDNLFLNLASKGLSYLLMIFSILLITSHIIVTRHPHYDIWLISALGIIFSITGITGSKTGVVKLIISLLSLAVIGTIIWFGISFCQVFIDKVKRSINNKDWPVISLVIRYLSLAWHVSYSIVGLLMVGSFLYSLYYHILFLAEKEYSGAFFAALLAIGLVIPGLILLKKGAGNIREMRKYSKISTFEEEK